LNNVYYNQFYTGNSNSNNIAQQMANLTLDNTNEIPVTSNYEEDQDATESNVKIKENFTLPRENLEVDSTITSNESK
jgi:hypothetical protein